ncbi:enoyl-CoA hydratase/isomerase family protein [Rhizobium sp. CECT 9324]|uniref:enoyl-CoA hydratase/isomerase family protein n=1 Tax=Rhizobium sp. CECT 9324 TaxID=2845820 RepID=UPI001E58AD4E|nr:enoyl-CoA hydratase/isomerase family protein [Rhizobium sp. CECT 9324]CAH0342794.1 Short-chain-enoyl-CoA hydratase [Rhizobium sp. CECT 9324]
MTSGTVRIDIENHVAILTVSRPEKRNALDLGMLRALIDASDEVEANGQVRAAILTGDGRGFCAGGDIKAWGGMRPDEFGHAWVRYGHRVFERLATLRMPLIAAINGDALGGGLELAGIADIRIADEQIRVGLPETGLGMVPGWSGTQRLVKRFGSQVVRRMALGGEIFTAQEARALGIVDVVTSTGAALAVAREYAQRVVARGPSAVEIVKLMIAAASGEDNGAAVEALGSILAAKTGDLKEGVSAFSEKRPAQFKGEW